MDGVAGESGSVMSSKKRKGWEGLPAAPCSAQPHGLDVEKVRRICGVLAFMRGEVKVAAGTGRNREVSRLGNDQRIMSEK